MTATIPSTVAHTARPGRFIPDMLVITRRNILRNLRLPQLIIFATAQPIMFLVLFTYVFGGAIGASIPPEANGQYINFLLPGLMVQIALFGASQTAVGLSEDLNKGVIDRFRSLPMSRAAVLSGRTLSDALRNTFVMTLMVLVAFAIGFRTQNGFASLILAVLLVILFAYAASWLFASLGLSIRNPEAVQSASFLPTFPLVFASSIFVPTATMPSWLQAFAEIQPVTIVANATRGLILGGSSLPDGQSLGTQVVYAIAWCLALIALGSTLAIRQYRRVTS